MIMLHMCLLLKSLAQVGCLGLAPGHLWKVGREGYGWYCALNITLQGLIWRVHACKQEQMFLKNKY